MKKTYLVAIGTALCWAASCNKSDKQLTAGLQPGGNDTTVASPEVINRFVQQELHSKERFNWAAATANMVQGALLHGDSILTIGYQPLGFTNLNERIQDIDIHSNEWRTAREEILRLVIAHEQLSGKSAADIIAIPEGQLPVIDLKVTRLATIQALRKSPLVRYAEPGGYGDVMLRTSTNVRTESSDSGSGCGGNNPDNGLVANTDYVTVQPAAKRSWNYTYHKIDQAWNNATGKNVKVMIVDTGVSASQDNLGAQFNQGQSTGRTIEKKVTRPGSSPADDCGHGTKMASVCTAPRGIDGAAVGVAYGANLVSVRAADDVFISSNEEITGVSDAFTLAGNSADVKIVSMSMGTIIEISKIADAIRYAKNKGKLIFCAAGTSFSFTAGFVGVIFPASMDEVVAVTGVKDNQTNRCDDCHEGQQVDFIVVMERASNKRHPLALAATGDVPSTVGGSSVATATCAGIAALVWSKYPSESNTAILNRMARAASLYNNKSTKFGWGVINANIATGGTN
ncbi:S8/S53 family peptidase [Chitinophaga pendula]|uniref:S8 family peptidase n=1 Tax=Chitinophaga TaxID=79328 RepID=UPI000BB0880A|nr:MULTISPECIES: S8/S53 family peptidase [Chitinophaga]ASZ13119.1 serine protease [Chitinophaga sp. MD30]UCJ09256.1 S8/S53 family peptidase [Chitinophaga pendula]